MPLRSSHWFIPPLHATRRRTRPWLVGLWVLALIAAQLGAGAPIAHAEATAVQRGAYTEYAVPNGPRNLAVEAPGVIWFTASDIDPNGVLGEGIVGAVVRVSPPGDPVVRYRVDSFGMGKGTEPYDLDVRAGAVWFTLRGTGQIGRIDIATRTVQVYPIPTPDSRPTGIDVAADGQVWFAESTGALGKFDPASGDFTRYAFPAGLFNAPYVEQLRIQNTRNIWFTLPESNAVGNFNPVTGQFFVVPTGEQTPTGLALDEVGRPWVTARGSGAVGRYAPGTVSQWAWFSAGAPDSAPTGIATFNTPEGREVWFAESNLAAVGRLVTTGFRLDRSETLPLAIDEPGRPWGVVVDGEQHIWIADLERNVIYETVAPIPRYFPVIGKSSSS